MELKQINIDWLYRFNLGENKDKFLRIIDPFKIPKQDLIFVLEHAVAQYTEYDLEEIVQPKFICPNGVSCHDVLDAVKVIKQFGTPKEETVADLCLEKSFQLQYCETYPVGKKEVAPVIEYYAEFNTLYGDLISNDEAQKIYQCRDKILKRIANTGCQPGEDK